MTEIKVVLIDGGIITAARQQHIGDAGTHGAFELYFNVELVQIFQKAAFGALEQIAEIVCDIILHEHLCSLLQKLREGLHLLPGNTKAVRQSIHYSKLMPELHLPDRYGSSGIAVGVADIKDIA